MVLQVTMIINIHGGDDDSGDDYCDNEDGDDGVMVVITIMVIINVMVVVIMEAIIMMKMIIKMMMIIKVMMMVVMKMVMIVIINNYWTRLSMIAGIIKTEVCVICRSRRLITQTEDLIIIDIMR